MIFKLYLKELKKNKFHFIVNSIFISFIFSIAIVLFSISFDLSKKYSELIDTNSVIVITDKFDKSIYERDNYFYIIDEYLVDCKLKIETEILPVQVIVSKDESFLDDKIYVSKELMDGTLMSSGTLSFCCKDLNIDFCISEDIEIRELEFASVYISEKNINIEDMPNVFCISIKNYDDIKYAYNALSKTDIDIYGNDNGLFSLYKSIELIKNVMISLSILIIIYIVITAFNMMKIYLNKKDDFLGLVSGFGMTKNSIFLLYTILLMTIIIIGAFLGIILSNVIIQVINSTSVDLFGKNLKFKTNYLVVLIILAVFVLSFICFFYRSVIKKISNNDLISLLKGVE